MACAFERGLQVHATSSSPWWVYVNQTSVPGYAGSPPAAQIASETRAASGSFRSAKATLAPSAARRWAVALPMPEAAPVTRATLPTVRVPVGAFAMCHGCHQNEAVASPTVLGHKSLPKDEPAPE